MSTGASEIHYTPEFPCVNCQETIPWSRKIKIYCSDLCKQETKLVRYWRSQIEKGTSERPDIKEAIQIRIAHINSGGYNESERRLTLDTYEKIHEIYDSKCATCGGVARPGEIDHIDGNLIRTLNSIDNLQLLCFGCHREKTMNNIVPIPEDHPEKEQIEDNLRLLFERVYAAVPMYPWDDNRNWEAYCSELRKQRKKEYCIFLRPFVEHLLEAGMTQREFTKEINDLGIPTISGSGKWGRTSAKWIIHENGYGNN